MKNILKKAVPTILMMGILLSGCAKNSDVKTSGKASPTATVKPTTSSVSSSPKASASASASAATSASPASTSQTNNSNVDVSDGYKNLKPSNEDGALVGNIFIGTFSTAVEYKDITITRDGKKYLVDDFKDSAKSEKKWTQSAGTWEVANGVVTETETTIQDTRYVLNDFYSDNFTLELKGRKLDGLEGFYVGVGMKENNPFYRIVLGGWQNTKSVIDIYAGAAYDERTDFQIDPNIWYDIKIVVGTDKIECYLNGVLTLTANGIS